MDGSGGMQLNDERGAEKCMDEYLKSIGLHRKKIAKDGSCLFRAVAEQVLHCQSLHTKVRAKCVEFLRQNRESYEAFIEGDFEEYLCKLQDPQQWVGEVEINALAVMYKRDFLIFQEPGKPAINITAKKFKDQVQLCFLNGNHYDSVYPITRMRSAAICQSILYELLYDGVFKERAALSACQRTPRSHDVLSDDNMAACGSSDESEPDADQPLWVEDGTSTTAPRHNGHNYRGRGRGRNLSDRVKRSLNPTLYRNVEYDVWTKSKRAQQKLDFCIAAGMQYTVGDRCQVRLDISGRNRVYNATIKEVSPNNGPVTVYVEDLGTKHTVPLWNLRPPGEDSWRTVVNRDKRLSNGHGEWDERGRGRGRGKPPPTSAPPSSVAQATGPGSTGRVQKQHSWPPQAATEEQGGTRAGRKSLTSAEPSPFGLTDKERLAREEEERNVALVEIQLRDEHSFPALGTQHGSQGEGGRRKGGEKRRSQRNTNIKGPVEDHQATSPSTGDRPKSSTPPLATTTVTTTTAAVTATAPPTAAANPAPKPAAAPPANPDSPTWLSKVKAPTPNLNMAAAASGLPVKAAPAMATSSPPGIPAAVAPPASALPSAKVSAHSYASAAGGSPASPPPCAAKSNAQSNTSVAGGAPPLSVPSSAAVFSLVTPALPAAVTSFPTLPATSSSPPSSSPETTTPSLPPPPSQSVSPPPASSLASLPTFIAPIAPSPAGAQGFLPHSSLPLSSLSHSSLPRASPPLSSVPHSSSPPSSSQISFSSSSVLLHHDPPVCEASAGPVHLPDVLPSPGGVPTIPASHTPQTQISLSQASLPQAFQSQASVPQAVLPQAQIQTPLAHLQPQYQSQTSLTQPQASLPQATLPKAPMTQANLPQASLTQATMSQASLPQATLPQPSLTQANLSQASLAHASLSQASLAQASLSQANLALAPLPQPQMALESQFPDSLAHLQPQSQSHPEAAQVHSTHPAPGLYPQASLAPLPPSLTSLSHPQSSVTQLQVQGHPAQPPHPSNLPHPSLSLSTPQTHPSLQTQTSSTQSQTAVQPPPSQHPQHQPESPAHPVSQQSHPPHSSEVPNHPHFQSAPPAPHHLPVPGAVPLQQLSQLYQDPLYPGFPLADKGDMAPTPPYSLSQAGDDLPRDVSVLRFFFNLGVKAYTNPIYSPCMYLLPLQQAHAMHPKLPSHTPSPPPSSVSSPYPPARYPPSNPPIRPQESYPTPQYPPSSASMAPQYDHHSAPQASPAEAPHPTEPSFNQTGYSVTQPPSLRMSWQQPQGPQSRNPNYPAGYPTPPPSYPPPQPSSQGYPPAQTTGHPLYPPALPQYATSSLGYPSSSVPSEIQGSQGTAEQLQPANSEPTPGPVPGRGPGPMEGSGPANMAKANSSGIPSALHSTSNLALEPVLLVDPPINNIPIWASVPAPSDARGGDSRGYRGHNKPLAGPPGAMVMPHSVGCNTEDSWEEEERAEPPSSNYRGGRRYREGGRGRGRGGSGGNYRRRQGGGEQGAGFQYNHFNPNYSRRGRERGY